MHSLVNILKKTICTFLIFNLSVGSPFVFGERTSGQRTGNKKTSVSRTTYQDPGLVEKHGALTTVHSDTGSERSYLEMAGAQREAQKLIFARMEERHQIMYDFSEGISKLLAFEDFELNDITKPKVNYMAPETLDAYLKKIERQRFKEQKKSIILDGISTILSPVSTSIHRSVAAEEHIYSSNEMDNVKDGEKTEKKKKKDNGMWIALGGLVVGLGGLLLWNQCDKGSSSKSKDTTTKDKTTTFLQENLYYRSVAADSSSSGSSTGSTICKVAAGVLVVAGVLGIVVGVMGMLDEDKDDLEKANKLDKSINRNLQMARSHHDDTRAQGAGLAIGLESTKGLGRAESDFGERTGLSQKEVHSALNSSDPDALDKAIGTDQERDYLKSAGSSESSAKLATGAFDKFGGSAGASAALGKISNSNAFTNHEKTKVKDDRVAIKQKAASGGGGGGGKGKSGGGGGGGGGFNLNLAGLIPQLDAPVDKSFTQAPSNKLERPQMPDRKISSISEIENDSNIFERVGDRIRKLFVKGKGK